MRRALAVLFLGWCVLMILAQCADSEREDAEEADRNDSALAAWVHLHKPGRHP